MDEVQRFCARMLGDGAAARAADQEARQAGDDRLAVLGAAVQATRRGEPEAPARPDAENLAQAVAQELAQASARLPAAEREALALRELVGLSYEELAGVTGLDIAAVAPLLAQARLSLRAELRGAGAPQPACDERERALTTMALRQDGEEVPDADDDWFIEHLGHCRGCVQSHAAMLEGAACYRAWGPGAESSPPGEQAAAGAPA
jgi:RNA polymerase sigma-70 factor (ECF subfamily)